MKRLFLTLALLPLILAAQAGREYHVRAPEQYNRPALVLILHGLGGNAEGILRCVPPLDNTIVVAPQGVKQSWNACACCGYAFNHQVDDVAFLGWLIDEMVRKYDVDQGKVFAIGLSNGGMMAHKLAGALPGRIRGIGDVGGTAGGIPHNGRALMLPDAPPAPILVYLVHGLLDETVPYYGSIGGEGRQDLSFAGSVNFWRAACGFTNKLTRARHHPGADRAVYIYNRDDGAGAMVAVTLYQDGHIPADFEGVLAEMLAFFNREANREVNK